MFELATLFRTIISKNLTDYQIDLLIYTLLAILYGLTFGGPSGNLIYCASLFFAIMMRQKAVSLDAEGESQLWIKAVGLFVIDLMFYFSLSSVILPMSKFSFGYAVVAYAFLVLPANAPRR